MNFKYILDLFYPNRCSCCGKFIGWRSYLCDECLISVSELSAHPCEICGKDECICGNGIYYDRSVVCFYYEGIARYGIITLKEGRDKSFGEFIGEMLGRKIAADPELGKADLIIPVPSSRDRIRKRGYNQALIIAQMAGRTAGIKVRNNVLHKIKSDYQHTLTSEKRAENVSSIIPGKISPEGMKVIVCDDVITTGNTMNRCAEIIKSMGAKKVYAALGTTTKLKKRKDENGTGHRN